MQHKATILRTMQGDQGTFGRMIVDAGELVLWSGELPDRDNVLYFSRINSGIYPCTFKDNSSKGPIVWELHDVPERTDVLLHIGNWCGDITKDYYSDVEGCIVIGLSFGRMIPPGLKNKQRAVISSGKALEKLYAVVGENDIELTIIDQFHDGGYI